MQIFPCPFCGLRDEIEFNYVGEPTPAPLDAADGWRDGWRATSVDDGWAAVEVSGFDAAQALMQATSADLTSGPPSAAAIVFGLRGLLGRTHFGFRVHVESPWLETLLAWLDGV